MTGFLYTGTSSYPIVAARDIAEGVIYVPFERANFPFDKFSPLMRIKDFFAWPEIITLFPSTLLFSTITIASAPSGIGAPVVILHASPELIEIVCSAPA